MNDQIPEPLKNVFRDLRDRRLLPLVIVLVAAIIAIPLLLSADAESPPVTRGSLSSAESAQGFGGAEITDPVVLAEVPGIRNYRKRLDSFQEQNPFEQQLTGVPKEIADAQAQVEADAKDAVDGATTGGGSGATTGGSTTGDVATGTDPGAATTDVPDSTQKTFGYFWTIDAKAGVVGEAKEKNGVEMLDFLPGESHPAVQFIRGVGESSAVFVVSRSVGDTHGDGKCRPHPDDCQFLALDVGESRTLEYEPDGLQYKIKLTGVHLERREIDAKDAESLAGDSLGSFVSGG